MKRLALIVAVLVMSACSAAPTSPKTSKSVHGIVDCKGDFIEDPDTGLCVERGK